MQDVERFVKLVDTVGLPLLLLAVVVIGVIVVYRRFAPHIERWLDARVEAKKAQADAEIMRVQDQARQTEILRKMEGSIAAQGVVLTALTTLLEKVISNDDKVMTSISTHETASQERDIRNEAKLDAIDDKIHETLGHVCQTKTIIKERVGN